MQDVHNLANRSGWKVMRPLKLPVMAIVLAVFIGTIFGTIFGVGAVRATVLTEGVSIGGGLKANIYAPKKVRGGLFSAFRRKVPVIVYVHGGGWIKGSRARVYRLPKFANERGYMVVSISYRPVPQTNIDGQLRDVTRGIRWVQNNIGRYGGNPRKIVIMGHSAGAHLVALVAAKGTVRGLKGVISNDVQAYDMIAYGGMRGSLPRVYAVAFGTNPTNWARWSPVTYVCTPPDQLPAIPDYALRWQYNSTPPHVIQRFRRRITPPWCKRHRIRRQALYPRPDNVTDRNKPGSDKCGGAVSKKGVLSGTIAMSAGK